MQRLMKYLTTPTTIAPLAVFRSLFGFIMLISILRFVLKGWVKALYIDPVYYFTFYGFEWVKPLGATGMYLVFATMAISALMVMVGYRYRFAAILFFLTFTYVELIDKSNYLNHYYFVSIVAFLLILLPANRSFSIDSHMKPSIRVDKVPRWTILIIQLQLAIVYFYAGAAKLNSDWMLEAMPLKIWLPAHSHLPIIGGLMDLEITAYLFSWAGAIYDLTIVFFLLYNRTRPFAYAAVVIFHLTTALLFPIGMFPYIMVLATLIFFPPDFHQKLISTIRAWFNSGQLSDPSESRVLNKTMVYKTGASRILGLVLGVHFMIQLLLPLRSWAYTGELFWTEQGYRFSWRVMLMEKAGMAVFHVTDPETNRIWEVANYQYLTPNQEKMMATQPDMILQFAKFLEQELSAEGHDNLQINVESYVTLNGRRSQPFIDPAVDLTQLKDGWQNKPWILPMKERSPQLSSNL